MHLAGDQEKTSHATEFAPGHASTSGWQSVESNAPRNAAIPRQEQLLSPKYQLEPFLTGGGQAEERANRSNDSVADRPRPGLGLAQA